jgi:Tfp pilus assembly protein PilZ
MNETDNPEYTLEQKNKRSATRAPLIVEKIPCGDGQKSFFGYAKNISRSGLFISSVNPREPGEEFMIELTLPMKPRHMVRCRCEVVWKRHYQRKGTHEPGMGLKFLDITDIDGDKIDEWVTEQTIRFL